MGSIMDFGYYHHITAFSMDNKYYIIQNRWFIAQQQRQRGKRNRVKSKQYNALTNDDEEEQDVWSWVGDNSHQWGMELLKFNIKLIAGSIFFLQLYSVYEYFRFGKIKWYKKVLWWLPRYLPKSINDKLQSVGKDVLLKVEQEKASKRAKEK